MPKPASKVSQPPLAELSEFYDALQALIRSYQFRDRHGACYGDLSVTECHCLEIVAKEGPLTINAVAAALTLEKSTISRVVRNLEGKGYVRRSDHPSDSRSVQLSVSPEGRRHYRRIRRELVAQQAAILSGIGAQARRQVTRVLWRIAQRAPSS